MKIFVDITTKFTSSVDKILHPYLLETQIFSLVGKQLNLVPTVQNLLINTAIKNSEEGSEPKLFAM